MTPTPATELITTPVQPAPRVPLNEMLSLIRDTELIGTYGREIIESQIAINRFDQQWRLARVFAESGMFTDAQQINQAMAKIQIGESWKMSAADAMQFIDVFTGRPSVRNEYLAAKMRDAGLDWDIEWHRDEKDVCIGCTLWPRRLTVSGAWEDITDRKDGKKIPASVSFTKAHADKVKVKEDGKWITLAEKATYQAYPEDLYFSKAIARLKRRYASNILSGMISRDEAEEIVPPATETPREKQIAPAADFMPGKQARRRAGSDEIPGTAAVVEAKSESKQAPRADIKPESKPEPAPSQPPVLPWKNKSDMDNMLNYHRFRVGAKAYSEALSAGGWVLGDIKADGGASVEFYMKLKELPDEEDANASTQVASTQVATWLDQPAMIAAFRVQRDRIGVKEFDRILNSKPGFMFGQSSHTDPMALTIFREMEAVNAEAAEAAVAGKKKLF